MLLPTRRLPRFDNSRNVEVTCSPECGEMQVNLFWIGDAELPADFSSEYIRNLSVMWQSLHTFRIIR